MNKIQQPVWAKEAGVDATSALPSTKKCVGNTGSGTTMKTGTKEVGLNEKPELTALSWATRAKRLYGFLPV
jgi:hypothetical protein